MINLHYLLAGKGPCNGDAECLNNGKCEPQKSSDAGECYCAIPYMGEFCEGKLCLCFITL